MSGRDFVPAFIARLRDHPTFRAQRERYEFDAVMVVETVAMADIATARDYAMSDETCGRVRIKTNMTNSLVQWFFELEEDAVLFSLKFCNSLPKRLV